MENPRQAQPVMDIKSAQPVGYQIVNNIPLRQPNSAAVDAQNLMSVTPVASTSQDGGLDHILQEVNREVAKATSVPARASRLNIPRIYAHEVIAVIAAAILIALTVRVYK